MNLNEKIHLFTRPSNTFVFEVGIVPNINVSPDWRCDVSNGEIIWADTYVDLCHIVEIEYGVMLPSMKEEK